MSQFPSDAPFEKLLGEARSLYPSEINLLEFKAGYERTTLIAHGWLMRVLRTTDAVLLMRDSGLAEESWPLRRAVLEHTLALRWVAERGDEAVDVVIRAYGFSAKKRKAAFTSAGWAASDLPVWDEIAAQASRAVGNDSESNMLTNFTERVARYGAPSDLAAWQIESTHSHPSWSTAVPYFDDSDQSVVLDPGFDGMRLDGAFCAGAVLRSLEAVNRMMRSPQWDERLREFGQRYERLIAARATSNSRAEPKIPHRPSQVSDAPQV